MKATERHPYQWAIDGKLPVSFWESTPTLGIIYAAARRRRVGPDVALHGVLSRVSAFIPPSLNVETGVEPASLNYFAVGVAPTGLGKSRAWKLSVELAPYQPWQIPDFDGEVVPGTGEGIAEAFMGTELVATGKLKGRKGHEEPEEVPVRKQTKHNALFYADEGDTISKLLSRTGATLTNVFKTGWVGGMLGAQNATEERTRRVAAGTYSMGLMISWQPTLMESLFSDAAGGTPQRFIFAPAIDPQGSSRVVAESSYVEPIQGIARHALDLADSGQNLWLPSSAIQEIANWDADRQEGLVMVPELDSHMMLHRAKVAALLALIHCEDKVSEQMWDMSGQVWDASCRMRASIISMIEKASRESRERAGSERAEVLGAQNDAMGTAICVKAAHKVASLVNLTPSPKRWKGAGGVWDSISYMSYRKGNDAGEVLGYGLKNGLFDMETSDEDGKAVIYLKQVNR